MDDKERYCQAARDSRYAGCLYQDFAQTTRRAQIDCWRLKLADSEGQALVELAAPFDVGAAQS